jgi:hypothetical protein
MNTEWRTDGERLYCPSSSLDLRGVMDTAHGVNPVSVPLLSRVRELRRQS